MFFNEQCFTLCAMLKNMGRPGYKANYCVHNTATFIIITSYKLMDRGQSNLNLVFSLRVVARIITNWNS